MTRVVKVGGSLYEWTGLSGALKSFLDQLLHDDAVTQLILVPGGGPLADAVRQLDRIHGLGEEASHWLALQVLSVGAAMLGQLLHRPIIEHPCEVSAASQNANCCVIDPYRFAIRDESLDDHLPHTWAATSDAFAARIAEVAGADELVLLKSTQPRGESPEAWVENSFVDVWFPEIARRCDLRVRAVNLRHHQPHQ